MASSFGVLFHRREICVSFFCAIRAPFVDQRRYLIMEYVQGGDMRNLLNNLVCFSEKEAVFYITEMILAVTDLHKLSYIHRYMIIQRNEVISSGT
jgi:serine/threonine protein kinase